MDESVNIISLSKKRLELHGCPHRNIIISEEYGDVKCGDCGERLNPIWVLTRMANEETKWERQYKHYKKWKQIYDKRTRTKCVHCGEMTPVRIKC